MQCSFHFDLDEGCVETDKLLEISASTHLENSEQRTLKYSYITYSNFNKQLNLFQQIIVCHLPVSAEIANGYLQISFHTVLIKYNTGFFIPNIRLKSTSADI